MSGADGLSDKDQAARIHLAGHEDICPQISCVGDAFHREVAKAHGSGAMAASRSRLTGHRLGSHSLFNFSMAVGPGRGHIDAVRHLQPRQQERHT